MSRNESQLDRRRFLQASALAAACAAAAPPRAASAAADPHGANAYSARTRRLLERATVIDMLAPLRLDQRDDCFADALTAKETAAFRSSRIGVVHHSLGLEDPDARDQALQFLAGWQGFVGRSSDLLQLVGRVEDIDYARAHNKVAVVMGIQNAEHFRAPDDVRTFHALGLRCAQLTYNSQTRIGSGSTEREDGGLSDFGAAIVAEMEKVGMLIDVSHCGDRTTLDAIDLARGPIAITHANCRALNPHPRLKTDEAIRNLAAKGGVIGITGVRMFVRAIEPTTIEHIVDHIDHVVRLVGIEHVGIGSDADLFGYDALPADQIKALQAKYKASYGFRAKTDIEGFDHPRKFYDLTEALIRRGYGDAAIEAILGGNFRRLLAGTWR